MIEIKIDLKPLANALRDIGQEAKAGPIIRDGLNRALDGAYVATHKGIGEHANLTQAQIKSTMQRYYAGGSLVAKLVTRSKHFSAADGLFGARDTGSGGWKSRTGSGTFFTPWKDRGPVHARKGFMASMAAGWTSHHEREFQAGRMRDRGGRSRAGQVTHAGIFHRTGKKRLPIEKIDFGPSTAKEMRRYGIPAKINAIAIERVASRFAHQYTRAVAAAKARYGL